MGFRADLQLSDMVYMVRAMQGHSPQLRAKPQGKGSMSDLKTEYTTED